MKKAVKLQTTLASGFIAGLVGAVLGLAVSYIGHRDFNRLRFESELYQRLHRQYFVVIGAGLGFGLGAAQSCIVQLSKSRLDGD
ncbi:MAG: hypothetical protein NZL92_05875 [Gloeomargarita sp. SKYG116]|nr:hypothetical protein [Gloeomargarita sp. SKYG116]MDW8401206.1 hypothetical protein [Gloeomargarita sp. SKYGB_i_bin116]